MFGEQEVLNYILETNLNIFWVHSLSSGVDKLLTISRLKDNDKITLTNSKGAYGESLAIFALFSMLYFSYQAPTFLSAYSNKQWVVPSNIKMLIGKTLLIVGCGANGDHYLQKRRN
jgi:phosphoglycerate dehydrogenase-like enzyme